MNSQPTPKLLEWINKRKVDLTPQGLITRLELWHAIDGDAGERLSIFDLNERPDDEDPADLTQEIWNAAEDDAATRPQGSHQRYVLQAFRGDHRDADELTAFLIQGRAVIALLGGGTEPPTERGVMAQDMRHRDDLHALLIRNCEATTGGLARDLTNLRDENNTLYARVRQNFQLEQELMDRKEERELKRQAEQRSAERFDALLQMGMSLLPVIASKFLAPPQAPMMGPPPGYMPPGAGPAPGGAPEPHGSPTPQSPQPQGDLTAVIASNPAIAGLFARDKAILSLLQSMSKDQVQHFFTLLTPQQSMAFMELYQAYAAAEQGPSPPRSSEVNHAEN